MPSNDALAENSAAGYNKSVHSKQMQDKQKKELKQHEKRKAAHKTATLL
jgi:hypothetical protein